MSKMKILMIDEINDKVNIFSSVLENLSQFTIHNTIKFLDCVEYYDTNDYKYVIIDHSHKESDELLEYILTKNEKQKIILLSDSLNCPVDCTFCLNTFDFVRLLKPVKIDEVFRYLTQEIEFSCPNKFEFELIDTVEKLFDLINLKEYSFYRRKEIIDGCLYFKPEENSNINTKELDKINNLIDKNKFETKVMKDFCLEVRNRI